MSKNKDKKAIGVAMAIGFELLTLSLIGIFAGYSIGKNYAKAEIGAVIGCTLAFAFWIWRLVRTKRYLM
ncbi:hypothetical protein K2X05_08580 [bacterium]|nr:hypothetical protein [bacterium]